MLKIACLAELDRRGSVDLLVLPFWENLQEAADLSQWKSVLARALASGDFKGKSGDSLLLYEGGRILLLGLGKQESITAEGLRRSYSNAARIAQSKKAQTMHLVFPETHQDRPYRRPSSCE